MPTNDEIVVVVPWDAPLKQSPIYQLTLEIFSGKAHEAPPMDTKRTMLLSIVSCPSGEYFVRGSQQAADFDELKKSCFSGWTTVSACTRLWTAKYTAKKLALILVLWDQVESKKKVRASPRAGATTTPQMTDLKRALCVLSNAFNKSLAFLLQDQESRCKQVRLPPIP
jgi:hypothetical protein